MNYKIFLVTLLILLNSVLSADDKIYYAVTYKRTNILASIELNGFPIGISSKEPFASGQANANIWILPKENKLNIKVTELIKGKGVFDSKLEVRIYLTKEGQFPDEGKKLLEIIIPESADEKLTIPFEKEYEFNPEIIPPSDLWENAANTDLTEEDKKEIRNVMTKLHKALNSGNIEEILKLIEFKEKDFAKAMYVNPEESLQDNKKMLKSFSKEIKGKLEPIPKDLKFKSIANGLIVEVTDSKNKEPIRASSKNKGSFSFPIYVSKMNEKWILVR